MIPGFRDNKRENKLRSLIITKITIFIFITLLFTIILAMAQQALGIDYKYITLPQWGPGIAALILSFIIYKKTINKSIRFSGFHPVKLLICLLLPIGMIAVGYFISKAQSFTSGNIVTMDIQLLYVIIPSSLFGAFGEALGWRCFLQSSLDDRLNYLTASVLVGTLWGLWHVGHYGKGLIFMSLFLVFTISFSIILAYLIREFDYNLLLAALFHFSANIGFLVFYGENANDTNMMLVNAVVWLGGAILIIANSYRRSDKTGLNLSPRR